MKHLTAIIVLALSTTASAQKTLDSIHKEFEQTVLGNEGNLYDANALASEAKAAYSRIATPTFDDAQKYDDILLWTTLYSEMQGDLEAVKTMTDDALSTISDMKNIEPIQKATLMSNWTNAILLTGDEKRARNVLNEILEIYADNGEDRDDYANALCSFASLSYDNVSTQMAEIFCQRALDMNKRLHGDNTNIYGSGIYTQMAIIKKRHKDYQAALEFTNKAIESSSELGRNMGIITKAYAPFKLSLFEELGQNDSIAASATNTVNGLIAYMTQTLASLNSYQRANFVDDSNVFLTSTVPYYAALTDNAQLKDIAYNSQLFIKGLLLNADTETAKVIEQTGDGSLKQQYSEISRLRHEIAQTKSAEAIKQLNEQLRQKETALMQSLRSKGIDPTANLVTDWHDVRNALRKDEAAIEFVVFRPQDNNARCFGALIVKSGCDHPTYTPLYITHDIASDEKKAAEQLLPYTIWDTLNPMLQGVKTVYFSPVHDLHKLPIEHIGTENLGMKLIRVSSTREITRNHKRSGSKAVVIGGIDYDCDGSQTASMGTALRDAPIIERGGVRKLTFLEGTKKEAVAIAADINKGKAKGALKGVTATQATGASPTEAYMKGLSGQHVRFLHIGTHGFYSTAKEGTSQESELTAMRRCGLFLAGANNALSNATTTGEDGILTASEIASLDFNDMELVTLSACQSGLGDISSEGVFGLQRAFKKAGASTLLTSLWKVDDEATTTLMVSFYDNIAKGMTKYDALEKAKSDLRANPKYSDKTYWAAFVLLDAFD